jgi:hypothetical protein
MKSESMTSKATGFIATIPRLENGDHLSLEEFEVRYEAMPEFAKAELIEEVVYLFPRTKYQEHSVPHGRFTFFLTHYTVGNVAISSGVRASIRVDSRNELQPDCLMLIRPDWGGQARISADDFLIAAPELIAEICPSSVSIELHHKLQVYQRAGVREYIVWRAQDQEIDWFVLRGERFELLQPGPDGIIKSEVFPGLWLDRAAMLADDIHRVLDVLKTGLASAEHQAFVVQLKEKAG